LAGIGGIAGMDGIAGIAGMTGICGHRRRMVTIGGAIVTALTWKD